MDNNNMLSQDEIDALLNPDGHEDASSGEAEGLSDFERDALGEIGNITFGSASTALSTILGHKVEITTPTVEQIEASQLKVDFPTPHAAISVDYTEGFTGTNMLVIKKSDAAIIADLMMGGDGQVDSDELTEMHISAVQEAMNQMMGSAATAMSTVFSKTVNISPPTVDIVNFAGGDQPPVTMQTGMLVKISFRLMVGDLINSYIMQLLPMSFAKEMVESLTRSEAESAPTVEQEEVATMVAPETDAAPSAATPPPTADPTPSVPPTMGQAGTDATVSSPPPHSSAYDEPQIPVQPPQHEVRRTEFAPLNVHDETGDNVQFDLFMDIPLQVTVELGRTERSIEELMSLSPGSVIELDKLAGEPVDIFVNQKLIAKGEVVVVDENFGVRVTEIYSKRDRLTQL